MWGEGGGGQLRLRAVLDWELSTVGRSRSFFWTGKRGWGDLGLGLHLRAWGFKGFHVLMGSSHEPF